MINMGEEDREKDNPDWVNMKLCEAYRTIIMEQISDLKKAIDKIDTRLWGVLACTITTILLVILSLLG